MNAPWPRGHIQVLQGLVKYTTLCLLLQYFFTQNNFTQFIIRNKFYKVLFHTMISPASGSLWAVVILKDISNIGIEENIGSGNTVFSKYFCTKLANLQKTLGAFLSVSVTFL